MDLRIAEMFLNAPTAYLQEYLEKESEESGRYYPETLKLIQMILFARGFRSSPNSKRIGRAEQLEAEVFELIYSVAA